MNRKTLTILIVTAVLLTGGIALAVAKLYSSPKGKAGRIEDSRFVENNSLVKAVPSDAAIVFCFKNFGKACEILGDSLSVFGELASDKFERLVSLRPGSLRKSPAIMSVHYSKDLPPLMIIEAGKAIADSTQDLRNLLDTADSSGLLTRIYGDLVLISTSQTVINSSVRHLEEGHSIIEANGFTGIASTVGGEDVLFLSNAYADNLMEAFISRRHRGLRNFIREMSEWTALSLTKHSSSGVEARGSLLYSSDPTYYLNVFNHTGSSEIKIAETAPAGADFILDIPVGNITSYLKAYRSYLDSRSRLDKYESLLSDQKKEFGQSAEDWAKALDIKEIGIIDFHLGEKVRQILAIRPGIRMKADEVGGMKANGFAATVFGSIFTAEDESACALTGNGWIVIGAADCVEEYSKTDFLKETLASRLGAEGLDRIPQKNGKAWIYYSPGEDPNLIDATFSPLMARGCRNILKGAAYIPVTIAAVSDNGTIGFDFHLDRIEVGKGTVPAAAARDTSVTVPEGPFKVTNCATGKTNTLYQNSHLSICLQDESGKDVWGVPFKSKIRGYVQNIDYYNNGKIQFLFAAGSQMYLIDRLGRFVSGFPVETGKKIAAGPAVYDFTGAKGYTAMVLHKDNTVGYYDLHGKPVASWKGITADETIKSLPELLEGNGKRYWVVRTSAQTLVFPFTGGEPLVKGEGNKMIRPDSKIGITDKGFSAVCYDGKERVFKSEN